MDNSKKVFLSNTLSMIVPACSLSKEDIRKIVDKLQAYSNAAFDIETNHLHQTLKEPNQNDNIDGLIDDLKSAFELRLTVTNEDGQELFGTINEVFEHNNFPEQLLRIYIDSSLILKTNLNYFPRNHFQLFINFEKPNLLEFNFLPSQPTPNNSYFKATGFDSTWANGIFNEFRNYINKRRSGSSWIHKQQIYDVILWLFGYPFGFWVCFKMSKVINVLFSEISVFIESAVYVYVFLISIYLIHFIFRYSRWIWPVLEYKSSEDKALKHRRTFWIIFIGLLTAMVWDCIKYLAFN